MFKICLTSLAAVFVATAAMGQNTMTSGRPSAVLTPAQCQEVWGEAVPSGEFLLKKDAAPYIVNWHMADGSDHDGKLSKVEFKSACRKGLVKYMHH